ncbi:diphosphomevalonate decarboxylase [Pediococcus claussenii]|uniref:diphosphomevalonate decarboxylase n=1 Tax=Pediococcus claussenii (strain ATCC BAA-344 / DSM 14800 / JCM 18046 / KCTC 3811 / LMG 21948 / P06) TaxID=701521 RepID=G8PDF6_PEDCP|nr:diphosphomevalonate decarboxylase [Pediococcus claussenii]AEV95291.1 diphosphomevalonate decarboxylase [Pediococcus claussenii ATCC BAA-344]ANZ68826.1 diphosphomevalonate decarboxylase [Pediococcus claussenii]ANZ70642.1 diphosphomevalonate decarboxylase [Pediococcus claussenii]KRN19527.1 mvaD protein [Pediococcus claussenii]
MNNTHNKTGFARAHTNIALVKYWGKSDEDLILPTNDSISLTLRDFYTDTEVTFEKNIKKNKLWINGSRVDDSKLLRVNRVIDLVKKKFKINQFASIKSVNHVPTSAGLASSASAMAALSGAAWKAATDLAPDLRELSKIARIGSGSASRSIYGGFVRWHRGIDHDTSFATPIPTKNFDDLRIITVVVNSAAKKILSTNGMKSVAQTSPFFDSWVQQANQDVTKMISALEIGDFDKLGMIAEQNAMLMHSTTLSANPAFTYFEPATLQIINIVHHLREDGIHCYFTIDAGPNVKIICQQNSVTSIKNKLQQDFKQDQIIETQVGPGITFSKIEGNHD